MTIQTIHPGRRAVLRAGSASLAALAVSLFVARRPAAATSGAAPAAPVPPPAAPGHRHLLGVL